jgi:hypothetical protein
MPKYVVILHETLEYHITVEAEDSENAEDLAYEKWNESGDPMEEFRYTAHGVEVVGWEEIAV